MATVLISLISLLLIVGASCTCGLLILRVLGVRWDDRSHFIWELGLGWGIVGYLLLFLATFGMLNVNIVAVLLTSLLALYFPLSKYRLTSFTSQPSIFSVIKFNIHDWHFIGLPLVVFLLLLSMFEVLSPSTTGDALMYHFTIPYDYVKSERLIYSAFQPYNMPHLVQMLVTVPFMFGAEDIGAHFVFFSFNILFIVSIYGFCYRFISKNTGILAVVLIFSTPMVTYINISGRVEMALTTTIVLAIWAIFNSFQEKTDLDKNKWLIISGAFIGLACGIKYYGLFAAVAFSLLIFIIILREKNLKSALKAIVFFSLAIILFAFPFYLKNIVMTGNPIYPAIFGGVDWSPEMAQVAKLHFNDFKRAGGSGILNFILSPWNLTMDGEKYIAGRTGYGFIYILFFPLFIVYTVRKIRSNGLKILIPSSNGLSFIFWLAILLWFFWFEFAFQRGRHLLPVFVILSIFIAYLVENDIFNSEKSQKWGRGIKTSILACMVLALAFNLFTAIYFTKNFLTVSMGIETKSHYLKRVRPQWEDFQWVNTNLPKDAKVLNLLGDRQYYLKREQFYPSPYFQGWIDWANLKNVDLYYKKLKSAGFTHVISNIDTKTVVEDKVNLKRSIINIERFNFLNWSLINEFGILVYNSERKIPDSRTTPSAKPHKKTFFLHELE
jgi:hypothetical protein